MITRGPKLVTCHEDDVFVSQLDKLMSDDSATPVAKGATVDAAIPMHLKGGGVRQSNGESVVELYSRSLPGLRAVIV